MLKWVLLSLKINSEVGSLSTAPEPTKAPSLLTKALKGDTSRPFWSDYSRHFGMIHNQLSSLFSYIPGRYEIDKAAVQLRLAEALEEGKMAVNRSRDEKRRFNIEIYRNTIILDSLLGPTMRHEKNVRYSHRTKRIYSEVKLYTFYFCQEVVKKNFPSAYALTGDFREGPVIDEFGCVHAHQFQYLESESSEPVLKRGVVRVGSPIHAVLAASEQYAVVGGSYYDPPQDPDGPIGPRYYPYGSTEVPEVTGKWVQQLLKEKEGKETRDMFGVS
uniref:HP n=1 Tax=Avocado betaflexivirus 1 TaxID=2794401 RepID=A0A7T5QZ77_9VIRU|nr:HP [Avocado betaflexivirus 1]